MLSKPLELLFKLAPRILTPFPSKFLWRRNHLLRQCAGGPHSSLVHCILRMLKQCILCVRYSVHGHILPAEQYLSHLIFRAQGTGSVIWDDLQSFNLLKVIGVYIDKLKWGPSHLCKCLGYIFISLLGLPG